MIKTQLSEGLFHIADEAWENIIIAYEPVWAIGTGETASPEQAQEMHKFIREAIAENYSKAIADKVSILYGGSVKPDNASEIFGQDDVDGGVIGGASLKVVSFLKVVNSFESNYTINLAPLNQPTQIQPKFEIVLVLELFDL